MRTNACLTLCVMAVLPLAACKPAQTPVVPSNSAEAVPLAVSQPPAPQAPPRPAGLSAVEEDALKQHVMGQLLQKRKIHDFSNKVLPCTQYFELGTPQIVDALLTGDSGKVRVRVPVTALAPDDNGPLFAPQSRYYYPSEACYGAPPGGWQEGLRVNSVYVVPIEHWQSGWRPSANEPMVQD